MPISQALLQQWLRAALRRPFPTLTPRDVRVPKVPGKAMTVIGVRRSGKTSLLYQALATRLAQGRPRDSLVLLGLDNDRLAGMTTDDLSWTIEEYYRQFPDRRERELVTLCLDEVQVVPGWEQFVRRLVDTERMELFLSGSSAKLLSREIGTSLRGRAMEVLVHPFSFREAMRHHHVEPVDMGAAHDSALDGYLRNYLRVGGFPEVQRLKRIDRQSILHGYTDTVVLRDVIERYNVSNPTVLHWLQRELLANPAGTFSITKWFNTLKSQGITTGRAILYEYLDYLEDAFLIRTIALHSQSARQRMVNPRKVYPIDTGLIPLFQRTTEPQIGHALETAVLLELERWGYEVGYVRTPEGYEVDFHASRPGPETWLIQVCADISRPETLEREVRALERARMHHPRARTLLLTLTADPPKITLPAGIVWQSAARWLLQKGLSRGNE